MTYEPFGLLRLHFSAKRERLLHRARQEVSIKLRDVFDAYALRTRFLALTVVGARAEVLVHRLDHRFDALVPLGLTLGKQVQVGDLRRGEEVCRTVRTCCDACTASDALGRVHGRVGDGPGLGVHMGAVDGE